MGTTDIIIIITALLCIIMTVWVLYEFITNK